jgi:hypothetical protein
MGQVPGETEFIPLPPVPYKSAEPDRIGESIGSESPSLTVHRLFKQPDF